MPTKLYRIGVTHMIGHLSGLEVESDSALICLDLCSMLDNQFKDRFYNTRNTTIDPFEERFNDDYTGSIMTVSLKSPFNYNRCQVPAIPINPDPVNPCLPATIRDSAGNLLYEVPSGTTQLIGDSAYIIKDQNGNILDAGTILAQGSKEIIIEIETMSILTYRVDPPAQIYQNDALIGLSQSNVKAFSSGQELMTGFGASYNSTTGTLDFGYEPSEYIDIWAITNSTMTPQSIINKTGIDTVFQDDNLIGVAFSRLLIFASGTEQKTGNNALESGYNETTGTITFEQGFGGDSQFITTVIILS